MSSPDLACALECPEASRDWLDGQRKSRTGVPAHVSACVVAETKTKIQPADRAHTRNMAFSESNQQRSSDRFENNIDNGENCSSPLLWAAGNFYCCAGFLSLAALL